MTEDERRVSRAIHEHLCKRDIMQYLDNDEDCEGLARAAITALQPMLDKARAMGRESGIEDAISCAVLSSVITSGTTGRGVSASLSAGGMTKRTGG